LSINFQNKQQVDLKALLHRHNFHQSVIMRVSAFLAVAGAFTANVVTAATAPGLTFLYSANSSIATPIVYGATPKGTRIAIPLTGGVFSGPKMNGMFPLKSPLHKSLRCISKHYRKVTDLIIQAPSSPLAPIGV
jgi:hypothetical protein